MILIINGPNLNMLGRRPISVYGDGSYDDLKELLNEWSEINKIDIEIFQSNIEGKIIDRIHQLNYDGLIINPGAYTHYSYAIRDALEILSIPKIEVHISNIYVREEFRKNSVISEVCNGKITGLGFKGYLLALEYLKEKI
ncbi:3-dehydroquinate dehydratase [Tepiditoga spiralis]|uniref:3-dehydroquinate dehydratase n=1 Tax=Tepiditoga spiralis TaxID=2108365 RepID=A0A7G1GB73_9BACT|nr:type II 3-dehydroquinate dehydratase [Tepiditoga spiralis]BBE31582.1 3-dehydroquinate dehydratase [Tepiditoga spiralis]